MQPPAFSWRWEPRVRRSEAPAEQQSFEEPGSKHLESSMAFNCAELAVERDSSESIRERLRGGGDLLTCMELLSGRDATIAACCANQEVLLPGCHRLFAAKGKLPVINKLREQVAEVYANNQRVVDQSRIDDMAWEVRKMLRLIKRKGSRKDVSLDPRARVSENPL